VGQFAIDIKEHANAMALSASSLAGDGDDISAILNKRMANSTDTASVEATYIGNEDSSTDGFSIEVEALAKPQVNIGNFLPADGHSFAEGKYSFDLDIRNHSYEFQFNVNNGENNQIVLNKLSRLINTSDVGLNSDLINDGNGALALQITSKQTGLGDGETSVFNISSTISWRELNTLGIANMTQPASNSSFKLNGEDRHSMANTFTVNQAYELTLKSPSKEPVSVGLMNDTEALSNGVHQLLESYNGMLDVGLKYTGANSNRTLVNEISAIALNQAAELADIGIEIDPIGHLTLDGNQLSDKVNSAERARAFTILNQLKSDIAKAASKASINPMAYVDKAIVEYKNPGKTLAAPYATSAYSGMMMNYGL
ncbi:MAG: flagellar capping protein, partial [Pseudobutyrivibrio sp.]|nr:flagellar capping protein [Pseudobutyrivibrio sp.]